EEGLPLSEPALTMSRRIFGNDHPVVVEMLINRGYFLQRLHRPADALPLFEEAYSISRRVHGEDRPHPQFVVCLLCLGRCQVWLGHPDLGLQYYEQALQCCRQLYSGPHPETAHVLHELGEALRRAGRLREAEACAREAVTGCREHPEWGEFDVRLNSEFW